ncbi:MAG: hypothetical protein HY286_07735 [Planctomycetes bacterium]|nr:hypothetical protein [Planctomycetota bacterium]
MRGRDARREEASSEIPPWLADARRVDRVPARGWLAGEETVYLRKPTVFS